MRVSARTILGRSLPILMLGLLGSWQLSGPGPTSGLAALVLGSILALLACSLREIRQGRREDGLRTALDAALLGLSGALLLSLTPWTLGVGEALAFTLALAAASSPWVGGCSRGAGATRATLLATAGLALLFGGLWLHGWPVGAAGPSVPVTLSSAFAALGAGLVLWRLLAGDLEAPLVVGSPAQQRSCRRARLGMTFVLPAASLLAVASTGFDPERPAGGRVVLLCLLALASLLRTRLAVATAPRPSAPRESAARLAALSEFSRLVAHEIRNALSVLFSTTDLLRRERTPQEREELLAALTEEGDRVLNVVGHLTAFARHGDAGRRVHLRLREVARTAARLAVARPGWPEGVGVHLVPGWDGDAVLGDAVQLEIALGHLLEAASGGGARRVVIEGSGSESPRELCVRVVGDGRASDEQVEGALGRLLEEARSAGGALGLAVAQRVAREHGGELEIGRTAGGGFQAELRLPRLLD